MFNSPVFGKFTSTVFLFPISLFSSRTLIMHRLSLTGNPQLMQALFTLFHSFSYFSSDCMILNDLSYSSLILSSPRSNLLL